jgi:hypothetical protein
MLLNNYCSGASFGLVCLCRLTQACEVSSRSSLVLRKSLICYLRFIFGSLVLLLGCRLILLRRLLCSLRLIDKSLYSIQLKNKRSHLHLKIVQSRLYSQVSPRHECKVGAGLRHELIDVTLKCVEVVADHTKATLSGLCGTIIKQDT